MYGTIKTDVIEDEDTFPILLACSIYYSKHVHILNNFTEKIAWTKKKKMWDKANTDFIETYYLRINTIDN